jgi:hypothetical protein
MLFNNKSLKYDKNELPSAAYYALLKIRQMPLIKNKKNLFFYFYKGNKDGWQ